MLGPPRGTSRTLKSRTDEFTISNTDKTLKGAPLSTAPVYSSFKPKQGYSPGFGPKVPAAVHDKKAKQEERKKEEQKTPGPSDYAKPYSSFRTGGSIRGKNQAGQPRCSFGNAPRKTEWIEEALGASPGVCKYDTSYAQPHRKDFRNKDVPLFKGGAEPRQALPGVPEKAKQNDGAKAPGPADYAHQYSSFTKATGQGPRVRNKEGKVSSTFGNSFEKRSTWQQGGEGPGVCAYDVHDPLKEGMAEKKSFRSPSAPAFIAGTAKDQGGRPIHTEQYELGIVTTAKGPVTTAGPGDYTAPSDFDVTRRTFNAYSRQQAAAKEDRTVPRSLSMRRSRAGSMASTRSLTDQGTPMQRRRAQSISAGSTRQRSPARSDQSGRARSQEHADPTNL